jgi:hypothetical protein
MYWHQAGQERKFDQPKTEWLWLAGPCLAPKGKVRQLDNLPVNFYQTFSPLMFQLQLTLKHWDGFVIDIYDFSKD